MAGAGSSAGMELAVDDSEGAGEEEGQRTMARRERRWTIVVVVSVVINFVAATTAGD